MLHHIGLATPSIDAADRFFVELLGMKKGVVNAFPAELMDTIFGRREPMEMVYYENAALRFEVFVTTLPLAQPTLNHACLEVADRAAFLQKASALDFPVIEIPKGEKMLYFLEDAYGNRYEIKTAQVLQLPNYPL
jgi:catechol 2,3-dioxygenase-like lactoylglutathione lyase family enzyme